MSVFSLTQDDKRIRATPGTPSRVSVFDVIAAATGNDTGTTNPHQKWRNLQSAHPELKTQDVTYHKFPGRGQRMTPVAGEETAKWIARRVLCAARLPLGDKKRKLAAMGDDMGNMELEMKRVMEEEIVHDLSRAFVASCPLKQFRIGPYRVDLYLSSAKIAIECDEHTHASYSKLAEVQRQTFIEAQLGCTFVRFDPCAMDFSLMDLVAEIIQRMGVGVSG